MSLNIKNERVHALAREAARRAGKSQTSVIEDALTRLLDDLAQTDMAQTSGPGDRLSAVLDIAQDFERRLSPEDRRSMSTEPLYDERGLPA